jgi:protein-L-isoaspartate(D-aspartate) O-methyltransferase
MTVIEEDVFRARHKAMLDEVEAEVAGTRKWLGTPRLDPRVHAALAKVARHHFVPAVNLDHAYENRPQPIGHGQTISQPYMVAIMTNLAKIGSQDRVLEIGTGCGYQTAILAELAAQVYSVEIVPELAKPAAARLRKLGYSNIEARHGDGALGWAAQAPFDAIIVTAAAWQRIPPALIEQLAPGGRLVVPVDRSTKVARFPYLDQNQELVVVTKDKEGRLAERNVLPVAFVPLVERSADPAA